MKLKYRGPCTTAWCGVSLALLIATLAIASESREPVSPRQLLDQFQNTPVFWEQFEIAQRIVALHDPSVLPQLVSWLNHEDRHLRGNAAFIFASLGDERGFDVIRSILNDRSRLAFQLGQAAIVHFAALKVQGDAIEKHRASGGLFYSRWRAAGISLLLILVVFPILFGMYLFASKLLRALG